MIETQYDPEKHVYQATNEIEQAISDYFTKAASDG